jgi:hypothetical protein
MSLGTVCIIVGLILMVLGACGVAAGRVSLWNLGWPVFLAGIFLFSTVPLAIR